MTERIVFIIQENPRLDVVSARGYGELKVIFRDNQQVFVTGKTMIEQARTCLKSFKPNDLLLLMGDPAAIAIVVGVLVQQFKVLNLLKWDRMKSAYYPVVLDFRQEDHHEQGKA